MYFWPLNTLLISFNTVHYFPDIQKNCLFEPYVLITLKTTQESIFKLIVERVKIDQ